MKMDAVKLPVWLTEEYRQQINEIRDREDLHKCRSVFDLLGAAEEKGEVEINRNCIIIRCNTRKGEAVDSCSYDGVLAVTEMRDGILLRLSHKRLLWLPVSHDGQENKRLMEVMQWLSVHCKYHFRTARLRLRGVDLGNGQRGDQWGNSGVYLPCFVCGYCFLQRALSESQDPPTGCGSVLRCAYAC